MPEKIANVLQDPSHIYESQCGLSHNPLIDLGIRESYEALSTGMARAR
jgi:hypothetical protein